MPDRDTDVLVLSSAIGSGHMRASAALSRGLELEDPSARCDIVDFPRRVSPQLERLLRRVYLEALKLWPTAYGKLYRASGTQSSNAYRHFVQEPGVRVLEGMVARTGARALVAPHFFGAGVLGVYKELHPEAFASVVLTDYVPHPIEIPPNLDLYIVSDEAAAADVAAFGVPEDRIRPTGIPIDPAFEAEPPDPDPVRRELLGLPPAAEDDVPVVMVMGGGLGGGDLDATVNRLFDAGDALHMAVLCGSNDHSRRRLARVAEGKGSSARFLGFTDRVRELMAAASVLVTKPGGLSCTEALACGLPQVLYHPIPGNEEDNARAMIRYGAAVMVDDTAGVLAETLHLLTSRRRHAEMSSAARASHRPHSAREAARLILGGLR